jgi:hypothetical protein
VSNTFFEATTLDDDTKETLCRELLSEFGVTHMRRTSGGELIHSCCLPFGAHKNGDRNPSASLNFKKLAYKCLGCGSGGGLLWFIAVCRGEDGTQARQWLETHTGTGQQVMELSNLLKVLNGMFDPAVEEVQQIPQFSESVLAPWTWDTFHPYLTEGMPEIGFKGRGIHEVTLKHFRVGYTDEYPMGHERTPQERVVIPLWWENKLVGWQARRLNPSDEPKYKNSPEFPRDRVFFNYTPNIHAVVVESPMSVLRHWHAHPRMMSPFGANMTERQLSLLNDMKSVTLWLDNDKAGWSGTRKAINALSRSVPVFVVDSPYDADPADMDDATVSTLIGEAKPWGLWAPPTKTLTAWEG